MAWDGSTRRGQLPKNWEHLRTLTRNRAGNQCEAQLNTGERCTAPGTDCDHITPGNNHHPSNLQWLCHWHHDRKTQTEAAKARRPRGNHWHPRDQHPAKR